MCHLLSTLALKFTAQYFHNPCALLQLPPEPAKLHAAHSAQAAMTAGKLQDLELGSSECKGLFCLDPDFTYLNHGSYGAAYK